MSNISSVTELYNKMMQYVPIEYHYLVKEQIPLEQYELMHKKEIEDAIYWGNIKGYDEHKRTCIDDEDQQYYNETFNPKEK